MIQQLNAIKIHILSELLMGWDFFLQKILAYILKIVNGLRFFFSCKKKTHATMHDWLLGTPLIVYGSVARLGSSGMTWVEKIFFIFY